MYSQIFFTIVGIISWYIASIIYGFIVDKVQRVSKVVPFNEAAMVSPSPQGQVQFSSHKVKDIDGSPPAINSNNNINVGSQKLSSDFLNVIQEDPAVYLDNFVEQIDDKENHTGDN